MPNENVTETINSVTLQPEISCSRGRLDTSYVMPCSRRVLSSVTLRLALFLIPTCRTLSTVPSLLPSGAARIAGRQGCRGFALLHRHARGADRLGPSRSASAAAVQRSEPGQHFSYPRLVEHGEQSAGSPRRQRDQAGCEDRAHT